MRSLIALLLLVLTLCPAPSLRAAVPTAEPATTELTWMSVRLGGRKIGHLQIEHRLENNTVMTTQTLSIMLNRNGKSIPFTNVSRTVETTTGEALSFSARTSMSAIDSTVNGERQPDGRYKVTTTVGGASHETIMEWPQGAMLTEGQRLTMLAASSHTGQHYQLLMFDPSGLQVVPVQMDVLGDEHVDLPGGTETLNHQRQILQQAHGNQIMDLWLDKRGQARKGTLSMIGRQLDMLACDETCAMAPVQDLDMFRAAMVESPRPLTPNLRESFLRYRVHIKGNATQPLIDTDEQHVFNIGNGEWFVDIGGPRSGGQPPPVEEDKLPNAWLQSDAPAVRNLAAQAVGDASNDRQRMRRLRIFVSRYITQHGLDIGYASALEVVSNRQGDCTEYAVLLAAMARAQGIPARVVTGMVYADRYANTSRVFLPHAWVQAWVEGRWQSYDSALRRFDSTHIALDSGDGDPWHFFNATDLFSAMRIEEVFPYWEQSVPGPAPPPGATSGGGR
ncbi:transglutaminase-like domain-containing protein [Dyella tabacisoli]|uniref:Transglutaminase domain-containing protein n=1 Tax=Dyella tabacisoli TaxID=2282381 RepID=A0A369UU86_9GAMM|nr:transglutaminase-like domain-containing protein [Dyella tabacisoli]RDD83605.1 transglutaminase domain-containing protein [Dyella tabacisoli]